MRTTSLAGASVRPILGGAQAGRPASGDVPGGADARPPGCISAAEAGLSEGCAGDSRAQARMPQARLGMLAQLSPCAHVEPSDRRTRPIAVAAPSGKDDGKVPFLSCAGRLPFRTLGRGRELS